MQRWLTRLLFGPMDKSEAIKRAGSSAELARLLGIKRQAVDKWPGNSIPPLRIYQLKELKPRWFKVALKADKPATRREVKAK